MTHLAPFDGLAPQQRPHKLAKVLPIISIQESTRTIGKKPDQLDNCSSKPGEPHIIGKEILVESFKAVFKKVVTKINESYFDTIDKRTRLAEALTSINHAILETKKFIRNQFRC